MSLPERDDRCFICGDDNPTVLHRHHVVPQRFGGEDTDENVVTLCANCHYAIERIYTDEVFEKFSNIKREQLREHEKRMEDVKNRYDPLSKKIRELERKVGKMDGKGDEGKPSIFEELRR